VTRRLLGRVEHRSTVPAQQPAPIYIDL